MATTPTPASTPTPLTAPIPTRIIEGSTLDAVIYADRSGIIRLWNDAARDLFGFSPSEALGESLDIIIPEKLRKAHWTGWDRVMETGVTSYGVKPLTAPGVTKNGTRVSLEFSIVMLKDVKGQVEGVAAVLRDVTERWEAERALRKRLRELEAQLSKVSEVSTTNGTRKAEEDAENMQNVKNTGQ